MRIPKFTGLIAAAAVLAACNGPNAASMVGQPSTATSSQHHHPGQALAAPGRAGSLVIAPGTVRQPLHRIHHDFVAARPCTALSDNTTGDVYVYNKNLTLAGDLASSSYGWGAFSNSVGMYFGRNDGSDSVDYYVNCTDHFGGTLAGLGIGGATYGLGGKRGSSTVYGAVWPYNVIEYWPNGGAVQSATDPNMGLAYFLDVDTVGHVWIVGWDLSFTSENLDECDAALVTCTNKVSIYGGFPGGVQVDRNETVYLNNQFGTLYSYDCSSSTCTQTGSFTYNNGASAVDYTALALDPIKKNMLWAANLYYCGTTICTNAQSQTLPLNSAVLGGATAGLTGNQALGITRAPADRP